MEYIPLKSQLNRVEKKMASKEGASITYALLLFLVCAVVSSVILAAGTAASGRISQSVETDQRYYAVTSAARILKDEVEQCVLRFDQTDRGNDTGTPVLEKFRNKTGWHPIAEKGEDDHLVTSDAASYYMNNNGAPFKDKNIYFSFTDRDDNKFSILNVDLTESVDNTGKITFRITSPANADAESDVYIMTLVFVPVIKISERVTVEEDVEVKHIKTQISWTLASMGE